MVHSITVTSNFALVVPIITFYDYYNLLFAAHYLTHEKTFFVAPFLCYLPSTANVLSNNGLECANGEFVATWDGCMEQESFRIRCPKEFFPCKDLADNRVEFGCWKDCTGHGGYKDCLRKGIIVTK